MKITSSQLQDIIMESVKLVMETQYYQDGNRGDATSEEEYQAWLDRKNAHRKAYYDNLRANQPEQETGGAIDYKDYKHGEHPVMGESVEDEKGGIPLNKDLRDLDDERRRRELERPENFEKAKKFKAMIQRLKDHIDNQKDPYSAAYYYINGSNGGPEILDYDTIKELWDSNSYSLIAYLAAYVHYKGQRIFVLKNNQINLIKITDSFIGRFAEYVKDIADNLSSGEQLTESVNNEPNPNYTHYAVNKETGKIVNGWDYSDVDASELKQFKKDYFIVDLIDLELDPKQYKVITKQFLMRSGVDPQDWSNWSQN